MNKIRYRFTSIYFLTIFFSIAWSFGASADDFHDAPYDFFFGNHIDTHQETKLKIKNDNPVSLKGFFYIIFTGDTDTVSGLPIARHPRGAGHDEECGADDIDCVAGWLIDAVPAKAKFLFHSGVNGNDHPVWMVNRVDIPQPGSFTHFHWIATTSSDPRAATDVPAECDVEMASELDNNAENVVCPGWLMQIKAIKKFAFDHGGEIVPVSPGIDNATHLNLVTNYAGVPGITSTR